MTRTEETGRHARRVLRWLEAGPATIEPAATEGSLILRNGLGVIAATTDLLSELARDGKILRRGARLEASGAAPASMVPQQTTGTDAAGSRAPAVNPAESPLGLLVRLKDRNGSAFLDAAEFDAGERLREDYTRGRIMPRIGASWEIGVSSGMRGEANTVATLTDAALAARQRVDRALTAVGPELSGLLVDVCCFLKGLELVERERGWPVRSAKVVLKTALGALARHYRPPAARSTSRPLHWGTDDYRPRLDGS